jgi:hypothetical protein
LTAAAWRALLAVGPPVLAFSLARTVLSAAATSAGLPAVRAGSWCRFDCAHYVSIALRGYEIFPCPAGSREAGLWCGNAAWLPGYPLLVRAGHALGAAPRWSAFATSALFSLLTLVLLWTALGDARTATDGRTGGPGRLAALTLAALFPGAVYLHAIAPLAPLAFAASGALVLAGAGRPAAAGLAAAAAAFTYPPGAVLAPVLAAGFLLGEGPARRRLAPAATSAALAAGGLVAAAALQHHDTGRWDAFSLVQSGYNYSLRNPLATVGSRVAPLFRAPFEGAREATAAQTLLVVLLLAAAGAGAFIAVRGGGPGAARARFVALYVAAAWVLPLAIGEEDGGLHRREAALVPLVLLMPRLPPAVTAVLAAAAALVAYAVALLFFRSEIL